MIPETIPLDGFLRPYLAKHCNPNVVSAPVEYSNVNLELYPNPSTGLIRIKASGTIRVYNAVGELILTKDVDENGVLDISNQAKGVYTIQLYTKDDVVSMKIVKR